MTSHHIMNKLCQHDIYLVSTLIDEYKSYPNYINILYDNLKLQNVSLQEFKQIINDVQEPNLEKRKYQKELEKQIVKSMALEEREFGEHFFYRIFNRINMQYKQLIRFSTSIGEFGIYFIQQKMKNQCYVEYDEKVKCQKLHEEVFLREIEFTIQKANQEKVISDAEATEINGFIKELIDELDQKAIAIEKNQQQLKK